MAKRAKFCATNMTWLSVDEFNHVMTWLSVEEFLRNKCVCKFWQQAVPFCESITLPNPVNSLYLQHVKRVYATKTNPLPHLPQLERLILRIPRFTRAVLLGEYLQACPPSLRELSCTGRLDPDDMLVRHLGQLSMLENVCVASEMFLQQIVDKGTNLSRLTVLLFSVVAAEKLFALPNLVSLTLWKARPNLVRREQTCEDQKTLHREFLIHAIYYSKKDGSWIVDRMRVTNRAWFDHKAFFAPHIKRLEIVYATLSVPWLQVILDECPCLTELVFEQEDVKADIVCYLLQSRLSFVSFRYVRFVQAKILPFECSKVYVDSPSYNRDLVALLNLGKVPNRQRSRNLFSFLQWREEGEQK